MDNSMSKIGCSVEMKYIFLLFLNESKLPPLTKCMAVANNDPHNLLCSTYFIRLSKQAPAVSLYKISPVIIFYS